MKNDKNSKSRGNPLIYLIHGQGGSRQDWLDRTGFTRGGLLTEALDAYGMAWAAPDLYGHGAWTADEPDFDPDDIDDDLWDKTVALSVDRMAGELEDLCRGGAYDRIVLVTYSAGAVFGVKLLARTLPRPVETLLLAAAPPQREFDDGYSLHNNLEVFKDRRVVLYSGTEDEEIPPGETRWFFERVPAREKRLREYPSGHSLPAAWTKDALSDLGL